MVPTTVIQQYGLSEAHIAPLGTGLINATWLATQPSGSALVVQRINQQVFKRPQDIAFNIRQVGNYFQQHDPGYLFTQPITTLAGEDILLAEGEWYRAFPFIEGSHTINVVDTPEQAYEAAKQFGCFTRLLSGFDATQLKITLPDFHHLPLRYQQFERALQTAHTERLQKAVSVIGLVQQYVHILHQYIALQPQLQTRVTHHDTKISNVLFDTHGEGLCVIDLDTVMPGYFTSDVGDMLRTYLCPVSEEESDFEKVVVRQPFYTAIQQGYFEEMSNALTSVEKDHFLFAGKMMVYMQAMRFLTDYLNNDTYYGARYEGHNLTRAGNQLALLQQLTLLAQSS